MMEVDELGFDPTKVKRVSKKRGVSINNIYSWMHATENIFKDAGRFEAGQIPDPGTESPPITCWQTHLRAHRGSTDVAYN